jgi:hypothetical protein
LRAYNGARIIQKAAAMDILIFETMNFTNAKVLTGAVSAQGRTKGLLFRALPAASALYLEPGYHPLFFF